MTETLDFSNICRICCSEGKLMSLFKVHISKKIMVCSSIQVWPNDGLPEQICTKCVAKLHISYQFRKLCEQSNIRLQKYVENLQAAKKRSQLDNQQNCNVVQNYGYSEQCQEALEPHQNVHTINHNQSISSYHNLITNHGTYMIQTVQPIQLQTYSLPVKVSDPKHTTTQPRIDDDKEKDLKCDTDVDSNLSCNVCGKEFSTTNKLFRHVKIHLSEHDKSYRCEICRKGFTHSGNFKVHMRMHTDERPYKCRICDKACRQQQDLEKHTRTHTGERPHGCKICGKAFSTSSNLTAHSRIHSGEKPYVCSVCQKAFCQSNELTKHIRTHTGEKSHICEICNKGFNGSSTLIVHMRSHTGERPYACKVCAKTFTQSSCLQIHLKRHQNTKKEPLKESGPNELSNTSLST